MLWLLSVSFGLLVGSWWLCNQKYRRTHKEKTKHRAYMKAEGLLRRKRL